MSFMGNNKYPDSMRCASYLSNASYMAGQVPLDDQEQHCRKFAEEHGWIVPEEYVYKDADKSGTSTVGRFGLSSLLSDAKKRPRPFQMLLTEDPSRLSRNLKDMLDIVNTLAIHGVHVYFLNQNLDSREEHFRMMLVLSSIVDEQYTARFSEKVRRGLRGRVLSGFASGGRCYGYRSVPVETAPSADANGRVALLGSRLEIVEAEAETIRRIYEMFTNGRTVPEMVKTLNTEQVATAKIGNVHSPWNSSRIRRVLRNTLYAGTLVWNRTKRVTDPTTGRVGSRANMPKDVQRVASPHLRVITDDVWNRAQARLARPGKGSRPTTVEDLKSTSH